jgi:hypothetical protein
MEKADIRELMGSVHNQFREDVRLCAEICENNLIARFDRLSSFFAGNGLVCFHVQWLLPLDGTGVRLT